MQVTDSVFQKFIATLTSLPGIGKKSAYRIGFHILRLDESQFANFINNLKEFKEGLGFCRICGSITQDKTCEICLSDKRDPALICVIEQPEDVFFIENTGEFQGKYHVLNGVISPIDGIGPDNLRIRELVDRIDKQEVSELLLATNPTLEGDATASYISNLVKSDGVKTTRIAHGVTIGSTLEYADQYTLGKAIRSRVDL